MDTAILTAMLRAQPDYVSGSTLAEELGVSRVSIWSHVERLKNDGIGIDAIRNRGYRIQSLPETLHPALLEALLRQERVTAQLMHFPCVDSTNSEAERQLAQGCPDPLVIVASRQTQGRGRLGRSWFSDDPGNLCLSFVFRPQLSPTKMQRFTLWIGLALCACLNDTYDLPVMLKWPNDLLASGKKIAGILTEARVDADHTRDLVVGCGFNINSALQHWPSEIRERASSLKNLSGGPLEINGLAASLIRAGLEAYESFIEGTYEATFEQHWQRFNALEGQQVTINHARGSLSGHVAGLDPYGALLVTDSEGHTHSLQAGDVTLSPTAPHLSS